MNTNNAWGKGRGRGYGRGKETISTKEPWKISNNDSKVTSDKKPANKMIDMATKYANFLDNYESSSSEEELHDDEILEKTIGNYTDALEGRSSNKTET